MKKFIWLLSLTMLFAFCKNETTESTETVADSHAGHDHASDNSQVVKASPDAPYIGLWVIERALGKDIGDAYNGMWFNLKADNTFESGKGQNTDNSGSWSYLPDSKLMRLSFSKAVTFPGEWEVQGAGDRILWKGNTPLNPKGTQMLLTRETVLPQN